MLEYDTFLCFIVFEGTPFEAVLPSPLDGVPLVSFLAFSFHSLHLCNINTAAAIRFWNSGPMINIDGFYVGNPTSEFLKTYVLMS